MQHSIFVILTRGCGMRLRSLDNVCFLQIKKINDIPVSMKGAVVACCLFSPIMVAVLMCYEKYVKKNI